MDTVVPDGRYIAVLNDRFEVYITLNKANDPPEPDEVDAIEKVVKELLKEGCANEIKHRSKLKSLGLNCMRYGFSVYIRDWELLRFIY